MTRTTQTWKAFYFWGRGKRTELTKTEGNVLQRGLKIGKHTYAPTYLEGENMNLMHNYSRFFS